MDAEVEILEAVVRALWHWECKHLDTVIVIALVNGHVFNGEVHRFRLEGPAEAAEVFAWCDTERGRRHCCAVLKTGPVHTAGDAVHAAAILDAPAGIREIVRTIDMHDSRG